MEKKFKWMVDLFKQKKNFESYEKTKTLLKTIN